jgi:DNA-binding NtrC family response regulator
MGMRVLLAGTNRRFLDHMAEILASKVEEIRQATTEIEVEYCLTESIDVVLLDLFDLKARGIQFMQQIKQTQPSAQIICFIPKGEIKLSIKAMRNGAFDELLSPFSWPTLLSKLAAAMEKKMQLETKRGFWDVVNDHFVAGSLAQIAGPEMGRNWLSKSTQDNEKTPYQKHQAQDFSDPKKE